MTITSPAFDNAAPIPKKYSCDGDNINPPLVIANVPATAKSLVLIVHDPDAPDPKAPRPGGFTHLVLWNIPPTMTEIGERMFPSSAVFGQNDRGTNIYIGPCPPIGVHRYFFRLFALDVLLDLPSTSKREDLLVAMDGHVLMSTELMGTYQR